MTETTTPPSNEAPDPSDPNAATQSQSQSHPPPPILVPDPIPNSPDQNDQKGLSRRVKDVEISVPIVYGTIAFWLGRKATESQSHKWTVYVRSATNEDLSVVLKRVVFQLHPSFNEPIRVVETPPFELTECGWGEFEIAISLHFHDDVCDKRLDLYHQLKLYPLEDNPGPKNSKRPVVMETYDEAVFPDPAEGFLARVKNHPAVIVPRLPDDLVLPNIVDIEDANDRRGITKGHVLSHWFVNFSEADELLKLAAARQQVQAQVVKLRRQMNMIEGLPSPLDPASAF